MTHFSLAPPLPSHSLSPQEAGKLTKMWSVCDWFKAKKNHTKAVGEEIDVAADEKAEEAFLMDFWKACTAWKHNKTWTWAKKNFTWFKKGAGALGGNLGGNYAGALGGNGGKGASRAPP